MSRLSFIVPGEPQGKGRPRFGNGRTFTPKQTQLAEAAVRDAWHRRMASPLPDGPVGIEVDLVLRRPGSHFKSNGELSAVGRRRPCPTKKPDWDNAAKMLCDALEGHAYRADAAVVDARVVKRWNEPGEMPHMRVILWSILSGAS